MSHFTVLVVGENPEEQLAPFQENNMGDYPREHLVFEDKDAEYRAEYKKGKTKQVVLADGTMASPRDDRFYVPDLKAGILAEKKYKYPDGAKLKDVLFSKVYETFEVFCEKYHGCKKDSATGRYGWWSNPDAKWDWHELGGRWTGFFKVKLGSTSGRLGTPGIQTEKGKPGTADSALKGDVDFGAMRAEAVHLAWKDYEEIAGIVAGRKTAPFGEVSKMKRFKGNIEEARKFYWAQPVLADLAKAKKSFVDPERYEVSLGEFLARAEAHACTTFAVVKDGKWYERGGMGWWGMVSNEKEPEKWALEFKKLLDSVPDDARLSVFDCHI
jgi:hypothetical protein